MPETLVDPEMLELLSGVNALERRVLGLLLTHRRITEPIVKAAGLDVRNFEGADHRLIFAGWLIACEENRTLLQTLSLIRLALREAELWDEAVPAGAAGVWHSDHTLARMATSPMPDEELDEVFGVGPEDGLRRGIARLVVALIDAAEALGDRSA